MAVKEWSEILGVEPDCTLEEARRAYRDLIKVWHPDRFLGDEVLCRKAELQSKLITEAFQSFCAGMERKKSGAIPDSEVVDFESPTRVRPRRSYKLETRAALSVAVLALLIGAPPPTQFWSGFKAASSRSLQDPKFAIHPVVHRVPDAPATVPDAEVEPVVVAVPRPELVSAAARCDLERVRTLLDTGAAIDQGDELGETALIWAAKRGCISIARELVGRGADQHVKAKNGLTPLAWARLGKHYALEIYFQQLGAKSS